MCVCMYAGMYTQKTRTTIVVVSTGVTSVCDAVFVVAVAVAVVAVALALVLIIVLFLVT